MAVFSSKSSGIIAHILHMNFKNIILLNPEPLFYKIQNIQYNFPMPRFDVITIFPEIFEGFLKESILGRAQKKRLISIKIHQLRKWAKDKHQTVDDRPFGGGPGMVIKIEPIYKAIQSLKKTKKVKTIVINFSPRGKKFNTTMAKRFSKYNQLIFICGRYEGIDERVPQKIADETISVGDYITIGGEVPTMAVIEAVSRFIPGVIGKRESVEKYDYPQYTRPEIFSPNAKRQALSAKHVWAVPKVLLSGDHKKIKEWRDRKTKIINSI